MPTALPPPANRLIKRFVAAKATTWTQENRYNATLVLNAVAEYLEEQHITLELADDADLNGYLATLGAAGRKPTTVLAHHRQLRAFYKWAAYDPDGNGALIYPNPMLRVPAPKLDEPDPADNPVAEEWEYHALMRTTGTRRQRTPGDKAVNNRRDAAIIALLWHTGIRRAEAAGARFEHLDLDRQMLHLARTKARGRTRSRDVYIPDEAMHYLDLYLLDRGEEPGPLFVSNRTRRGLEPNGIYQILKRRARQAEATQRLPGPIHVPTHSFRRASAIAWLEHGGSVIDLETNHGWRHDGRMAAHYTRKAEGDRAAGEARRIAELRAGERWIERIA